MRLLLLLTVLLAALPSAARAQNILDWDKPGAGAELRAYRLRVLHEVNATLDQWRASWEQDDATAVAAHYQKEATLVLPDGSVVQGNRAIRDHFAGRLAALRALEQGMMVGFGTSGDIAYKTFRLSYEAEGKGTQNGVDTLVLNRQGNGSWKIQMHVSTVDPAPPPTPTAP